MRILHLNALIVGFILPEESVSGGLLIRGYTPCNGPPSPLPVGRKTGALFKNEILFEKELLCMFEIQNNAFRSECNRLVSTVGLPFFRRAFNLKPAYRQR